MLPVFFLGAAALAYAQNSSSASATPTSYAVQTPAALFATHTSPPIRIFQTSVSFAPSPLPTPNAVAKADAIYAAFANLGRTTLFRTNQTFDAGAWVEAEGMVKIGDRYFIAHNVYETATAKYPGGAIINGTDRTPGSGYALLSVLDSQAQRIATVNLSDPGALEYHIGGIDYDGQYIWGNVAQYRPNSTQSLVRIDPLTLNFVYVARFDDHAGGVIRDTANNTVVSLNWGARNASYWSLDQTPAPYPNFTTADSVVRNPSYYVDYQDCKWLGPITGQNVTAAFCSGIATLSNNVVLGGLAIVDVNTMVPLLEVPLQNVTANNWPLTQNPSDIDIVDGQLRFYFFPDQNCSNCTLNIVDALVPSPYEY